MEFILFDSDKYQTLYNCSSIDAGSNPMEQRRHVLFGMLLIVLTVIYHVLYIPCLFSLRKLAQDNSCYKFLFFIGILDVMALWMCGFLTGIFAIMGIEFCDCPTLNYVAGAYGLAMWIAESTAEWVLAVNRSLEMLAPTISHLLFDIGERCHYWIAGIIMYAFIFFFATKPLIYSAKNFIWFFNPFEDYQKDDANKFANYYHAVHNIFLSFAFPITYITFFVALSVKVKFYTQISSHSTNIQKLAFIQVFLLGVMNTFGCVFYLYMQYVEVTDTLMIFATFNWLNIHGLPPLIYLTINKSIRMDCLQMSKKFIYRIASFCCPQTVVTRALEKRGGKQPTGISITASFHQRGPTKTNGERKQSPDTKATLVGNFVSNLASSNGGRQAVQRQQQRNY